MLGSQTLEVAIGVAVLFSFMSLFATAARETIEAWAKQRARLVHRALEELFDAKPNGNGGAIREFYESITISPLFSGKYSGRSGNLPSYIPSKDFAAAVLGIARKQAAKKGAKPEAGSAAWVDKISDPRIAALIRVAVETAGSDPDKVRAYLASWFDSQMDRVSGWYKRSTHWILLTIGLFSAVLLNVDAIAVTDHLYRNDAVRQVIVAHAQSASAGAQGQPAMSPGQALGELDSYGFPMGWDWSAGWPRPVPQCALHSVAGSPCRLGAAGIALMVLGWMITAFAISLGAPFWFDLLNKFMVIRSTVKPFEKSGPEGSEDRAPQRPGEIVLAVPGGGEGAEAR